MLVPATSVVLLSACPSLRMGGREAGKCQEWGSCPIWPGQRLPSQAGLFQNVAEFVVRSVKALGARCFQEKMLSCPWCRDQLCSGRVGSVLHGGAAGAAVPCWHPLSSLSCTVPAFWPVSITPTSACQLVSPLTSDSRFSCACPSASVTCFTTRMESSVSHRLN